MRAALRVELDKLGEQLTLRVLFGVCLLGPPAFALVMRFQSSLPADTLFGRWAKTTGFATSLTVLGFAGSLGLPFLAGLVAGDLFSSEDRYGTWKTILTRSSTRADVFVGKTVTAVVATTAAVVMLTLSSLVSGVLVIGSDALVGLSGQLVSPGDAWARVLGSWAIVVPPTLVFVALALLLSVATRSGIIAVLGTGLAGLAMQLVSLVGSSEVVRALLPTTAFDGWHGLFTQPAHYRPLLQGTLACLVWIAGLLAAAWFVLRRRTFAGADSVTRSRRRTAVRTAVALGAAIALLAVASGAGTTDITARRLEAAVTPTFERLVVVRYRWLTHKLANAAAVQVTTACRRGGGTRASRGPGDDWACVVHVQRPQPAGVALTLELTVRANGCYTAQGPPTVTGGLKLRDTRGKTITNPLYAFDGCLGTP